MRCHASSHLILPAPEPWSDLFVSRASSLDAPVAACFSVSDTLMNPLLPTFLWGKDESESNPYKTSRHAENKIALRLASVAENHCSNLIRAFNECARGRSVSMIFACRPKYDASQQCIHVYVNEENLAQVKKRWIDAGRPRQVDWNALLEGIDKPPPADIAAMEAAAAQQGKDTDNAGSGST